jgi:hypothetical protein
LHGRCNKYLTRRSLSMKYRHERLVRSPRRSAAVHNQHVQAPKQTPEWRLVKHEHKAQAQPQYGRAWIPH